MIMRMTIEIDAELLRQAQKALGTTTIRGTVDAAIRAIVRQRQLQALATALGTTPLELTPEQLRRQRRKRTGRVTR